MIDILYSQIRDNILKMLNFMYKTKINIKLKKNHTFNLLPSLFIHSLNLFGKEFTILTNKLCYVDHISNPFS